MQALKRIENPDIRVEIPAKLTPCLEPYPYKVLYGGRGGAKSRTAARILIAQAATRKMLILCTRELQKSIKDSVHRVLVTQLEQMGLEDQFEILQHTIIHKTTGSEFIFTGLKNNATEIKSMEGLDAVWCEEAETISEESWDVLIPTVRKDGAEIWITFNPDDELSDTWQRWVVNPPKNALVININYWDNPWFPDLLRSQMSEMKKRDFQKYLHIWEGEPNADYEDSIVKPEWFDAAIDAHKKLGWESGGIKAIGFDPADDGSDAKAYARRYGSVIHDIRQWDDGDLADAIEILFDYADETRVDAVIYDGVGIGAGMKVALRAKAPTGKIVFEGFYGGDGVRDPDSLYGEDRPNKDTFYNLRAQYYWYLRDRFQKTYQAVVEKKYINPDECISISSDIPYLKQLRRELASVKRKRQLSASKIQIMSKEDMRKDGIKSPNMADALMMCFGYANLQINSWGKPIQTRSHHRV